MRYFPTNCDQPAYWHDYNSLEMPSSRESSSPPIPDPSGNQGTSEISSSSEGIARTTASGGDDGGGESSESILSKSSVSKRIDGKRCGVCGDRALGYNFNAITCESCKAFFRRNALKNKEYRCPFNDECEVTAVTRRFCQRCRLRKCFEVGMKKEWIMTEEEKKTKRKKIMENRAKKGGEGDPTSSGGTLAAPPYLSGENKFENMNTISEQRTGIDAMADEIRSALIPTAENPLGLKPTGLNQKPKAVVVGRVRVEENDNKVRKIGLESDVHSQKQSTTESSTSIELEVPNPQVFSSHIGVSSNLFDLPPQPHFHPAATLSSSLPSTHLHHQSSTHSPSEGLVAGLLRTQSRGSAESDLSTLSQASLGCLAENLNSEALVMVKKEVEDPPFCESKMLEESDNSNSIDINAGGQFTFSILGESAAIFCQNSTTNLLPNTSSVKEETKKNFEFSIQDALNMIQPGCKDLSNDSKKFSGTNVMDSILNTAISAEYSAFSLLMNSHSSELNQAENIKITELLEASKGLNSPLCEEPNYKDLPNPSLINVINLTEIAIRRLIKMAKKISAFKSFCQEDQIALLKGGCAEMMILRSVSAYDPDKEVWKIQQDHERFKNIKLKVLKAASGNVYEEHKRFILSFNSEWRQDARIMALLAAVALFTPERPNVIHPQAVRHEQSSYLYLLKRYMECKYGGCLGKTNYLKLLEIISNLHTLNEEHVKVFLEVNPQEVEPLLIEIFDLKQS
ncbi:UNVERIFIED_CONTAM: hypothetical protein RMT77_012607 [Armadillidium vulgare]